MDAVDRTLVIGPHHALGGDEVEVGHALLLELGEDVAKDQAREQFDVNSLAELQAKATQTYQENLAQVEAFEAGVKEYVASVTAASKIGEGAKA